MAELTATAPGETTTAAASCCGPAEQASCCEPTDKAACCDASAAGESCGCAAGQRSEPEALRAIVRARYAAAARAVGEQGVACDCAPVSTSDAAGAQVFGGALYDDGQAAGATATAVQASLGCGVPTAVADLHPGETVLDLGSGGGADVLISARRVAPTGRAIGLDMTDEMLALARSNAAEAGVENVEFVRGYIEDIPLADASVDVVISICVINLSADKPAVLREAARVLRPGGRFAVSDVIADPDMDAATRADMQAWTGCVAGALTRAEFERALRDAGLVDVDIRETHRVHEHASSAIVRARKPPADTAA
jgi:arsenite methyltransferase